MFTIKRGLVNVLDLKAEGALNRRYMDASNVSLNFTLTQPFAFAIGDSVVVHGETFYLNKPPQVQELSSFQYNYTATFESRFYDLTKVVFVNYNNSLELDEGDFSLMGNAELFIDLIITNANRNQAGWTKGIIDVTEAQNLTFSANTKCLTALTQVAEAFQLEYWIQNQTINLTAKGVDTGLTFSQGKGSGLVSINRVNENNAAITTMVYARGSSKNIPANYRNFSTRLKMPVARGIRLTLNDNLYGKNEEWIVNDNIFPRRTGVVTSVNGFLKFTDNTLDFNLEDYRISKVAPKVVFQTGALAGVKLEISAYNNATKEFTLNINTEEKALQIPSDLIKAAVGDIYIVEDITMPPFYVAAAEEELYQWAFGQLQKISVPRVQVTPAVDRIFFKNQNITLNLGDKVHIDAPNISINRKLRILGYTQDINDAFNYTSLELAETALPQAITSILNRVDKVNNAIRINNLLDPAKARRNWRDSQELLNLVFDPEGDYYTDKIKPLSIETTMLSVGARSQQFELNGLVVEPNFQGIVNEFRSSAAVLDHFSIDPTQVKSWNIAASSYSGLITASAYYIYAKCDKANNNGTILLSQAKITFNQDANYYHFLLGVLHSAASLVTPRGLSLTYGQTTVNGKFIKTGKIQSQDGSTFFDLDNGTISGRISFLPDGGGNPQLLGSVISNLNTSVSSAQTAATNAQNTASNAVNDAAVAAGIANGKGKVITQSAAPSVADQNAVTLWIDTTNGANTPKRWSGAAWVAITDKVAIDAANNAINALNSASFAQITANEAKGVTDNFTIINGGLIYSNTLKVGSNGIELAGITAVGTLSNSIRFWAGSTYENRNVAPFRVQQDGKVFMTNAVISGEINASSGTIAGVQITAGNNFSLDGSAVKIVPDKGVNILNGGFITLPTQASIHGEAAGKWQMYVDEVGLGGTAMPLVFNLGNLSDVNTTGVANDFVLYYHAASATFKFKAATFGGGSIDAYTKSESNNFFSGVTAITGYNKSNWDNAASWGNHAGLYSALAHTHTFASLTAKPTTVAGYGITNLGSAAYLNASQSLSVNTVVQRDGNGYVFGNYINMTDNVVSSGVSGILVKAGDNYYRTATASAIISFLGIGGSSGSETLQSVTSRGATTSTSITAGVAQISTWSSNAIFARFGHSSFNTDSNYGFLQRNDGYMFLEGTGLIINTPINGTSATFSSDLNLTGSAEINHTGRIIMDAGTGNGFLFRTNNVTTNALEIASSGACVFGSSITGTSATFSNTINTNITTAYRGTGNMGFFANTFNSYFYAFNTSFYGKH